MFDQRPFLPVLLLAFMLIAWTPVFAQENIGFEKGTFDNWGFAVGKIDRNGEITTYEGFADPNAFKLYKNDHSDLRDDYGKFSVFSPNGSGYSVKLGNTLYGNNVQQMSYKLKVPATGINSIIFNYAVVLVNLGHAPQEQPRFTVKVYNETDKKYLDCPSFDFIASPNLPGFKLTNDSVFYKDWSSASINLKGLNNKEVRLEFTVNHCVFGQHFGYAYIDVSENIGAPIQGNNYCTNQTSITLAAPPGFATYKWFTADLRTELGTGQYLTMPPPPNTTGLAVKVEPYDGLGCPDVLYTTVNGINEEFKFVAKETIEACPGEAADLTLPEITQGSSANLTFDYLTDEFEPVSSPFHIAKSGRYYIRATNPGGCSNLLPIQIVAPAALQINNPAAVTYPATVNLAETFTAQPNTDYSYYRDAAATIPITNYTAIETSGTYFIKAESAAGCVKIEPVPVNILPPPPFVVSAPNTFTPNDDGINDRFLTMLDGYIVFGALKIYNRNGALVFRTGNNMQAWDGTINGRQATAGTYYWVLEGYDSYYHQKVSRSSFITLLR